MRDKVTQLVGDITNPNMEPPTCTICKRQSYRYGGRIVAKGWWKYAMDIACRGDEYYPGGIVVYYCPECGKQAWED
jgi:hypothetical protein